MSLSSPSRQRGITLLGFIIVAIVLGFFGLMIAKLLPAYTEFNSVKRAMDAQAAVPDGANRPVSLHWTDLLRRFDISYVQTPQRESLTLDRRKSEMTMAYEYRTPFVYNIDFAVRFSHTVKLK
jgi:Tfp pilus assembly protein PilE